MTEFEFLQKIDNLKEIIGEEKTLELYNDAEEVIKNLKDNILDLRHDLHVDSETIDELKSDVSELQDEVDYLSEKITYELPAHLENVVFRMSLDNLFENIHLISADKIDEFVKQNTK